MRLRSFAYFFAFLLIGSFMPTPHCRAQDNELKFGMSTVLSGPAKDLGINMRDGVLAGFERANAAGGIRGKKLRLVSLDDGYEPRNVTPNMRRLVGEERVLGIVGNVGTPTAIAAIPIALETKTLFFAPFTGASVLRKTPPDRYVINFRASYFEETAEIINALIDLGGIHPEEIAFFTQRDGYGDTGFAGGLSALKQRGLTDERSVVHVRYERNSLAVENALADLLIAEVEPKAVVMVGAYAPSAKFIRLAIENGINPLFLNVSFVGSESLARQLGDVPANVIVTQVVPDYRSDIPIANEFIADLNRFNPAAQPNYGSFEGYVSTRILLKALESVSEVTSSDALVKALENLGKFSIGLGVDLQLGEHQHQASHTVWPTVLQNGVFVSMDWSRVKEFLRVEQ